MTRSDRSHLAERWRVAGERLRKRSPAVYAKLVDMLAASVIEDDDEAEENIDAVYLHC
jgi:hypothetical protein